MPLSDKKIKEIFEKHKKHFIEMEHYDQTREILWARKRIDITILQRNIKKLKDLSKKTGKSMSNIIEESISKLF